jgi:hypothetical protein
VQKSLRWTTETDSSKKKKKEAALMDWKINGMSVRVFSFTLLYCCCAQTCSYGEGKSTSQLYRWSTITGCGVWSKYYIFAISLVLNRYTILKWHRPTHEAVQVTLLLLFQLTIVTVTQLHQRTVRNMRLLIWLAVMFTYCNYIVLKHLVLCIPNETASMWELHKGMELQWNSEVRTLKVGYVLCF